MNTDYIEKLYDEPIYYDTVRNAILRATMHNIKPHDLEDCVSEVYVIALKKQNEVEKHPYVHGWLNLTAKNVAKRFLERIYNEKKYIAHSDYHFKEADYNDEDKISYIELSDTLKKNLKPFEYRLFTMKFIEQCSAEEMSKIFNLKPHAIEARVTRLKAKINKILKEI